MKKENQVCDLKYAKQLKELNCPQESLWWWRKHRGISSAGIGWRLELRTSTPDGLIEQSISAFTVAELGELLPSEMCIITWIRLLFQNKIEEWEAESIANLYQDKIEPQCEKTEANARAKMLVYLLENKLLEL